MRGRDMACLCELACRHQRKVDVGLRRSIEVVREDVQRHVRDDFRNLTIGVADGADTREILIANIPTTIDDGSRELERGSGFRIGRAGHARRRELVIRESCAKTKRGMRRETVIARIRLGDRERDLLLQARQTSGRASRQRRSQGTLRGPTGTVPWSASCSARRRVVSGPRRSSFERCHWWCFDRQAGSGSSH